MKKSVFFLSFLLLISVVLFAKPVSHYSFGIGPSISSEGLDLVGEMNFSLDFWVAHIESGVSVNLSATNNTLVITPNSSRIFKYVDFDWKNFRVEYGATNVHSRFFPTLWDVGNLPDGWTITLNASNSKNDIAFMFDRKTYIARYSGPFLIDMFWYANSSFFTLGTSNGELFLNAGNLGSSYFIGGGGSWNGFSSSVIGFSDDVEMFPNVERQIPSRYVGMFEYKSKDFSGSFVMTENEFFLRAFKSFSAFGGNADVSLSVDYLNSVMPYFEANGNLKFAKPLGKGKDFFVEATWGNDTKLLAGMEWRF